MSIAPEFATMTPAPVPKFSWVIVHESISHVEFVGSALPLPGYCDSYGLVDNLEDAMAIWAGGVSCIKNLNSPAGIDRIYGFSF